MGKKGKGKSGDLGKALVRDRFGSARSKRTSDESCMLHTANIEDGYKWDRLDLKSVTEESSFQEFLSTAQLAGTEFRAEKLNIKYVNPNSGAGVLSTSERSQILEAHRNNKDLLKIPRRPKWDESMSGKELQNIENEEFLEWRRKLALEQEARALTMTPYEKNLEFWRQLWRVVERSDIVVQIVDARNPLLFRCEDLECYVKEISVEKMNMILVNKADFLTEEQRKIWADYFSTIDVRVVFFSALLSAEETMKELKSIEEEEAGEKEEEEAEDDEESTSSDEESIIDKAGNENNDCDLKTASDELQDSEYESALEDANDEIVNDDRRVDAANSTCSGENTKSCVVDKIKNSSELLNREKLISLFKTIYVGKKILNNVTTVGLVGYPNVGKSSTINALLMDKKVSVSATPGKTKHFQTLYVDGELLLCDCPGLVMPSFVCTKAEMILNGILPIDQMRDHVPAVNLVGDLIPRHVIEDTYGIMLPLPMEGEEPDRSPTSEEILNTYGYNRGFMTQNGQPNNPHSARYILKDYVNGKLLYCVAPPGISQMEFHKFPPRQKITTGKILPLKAIRASRGVRITGQDVDNIFFQSKVANACHVRGGDLRNYQSTMNGSIAGSLQNLDLGDKPWKKINKHVNKKKREKSRRLFAHLDQH